MTKSTRSIVLMAVLAFVVVLAAVGQQKSADTAIDPVCGMTVVKANAKATTDYNGTTYYFCNPGCKEAFAKDPEKYLQAAKGKPTAEDKAVDPVCGMTVVKANAKATFDYKGTTYYFCNTGCKESFAKDPEKYLAQAKGDAAAPMGGMHGMPMKHGQAAEGAPMAGCPMMQGGKGTAGMTCGPDCPLHGPDVDWSVEKTKDGVTVKVTAKNAETVKAIQDHMTEHVAMMKKMKEGAAKAPEGACCPSCAKIKGVGR